MASQLSNYQRTGKLGGSVFFLLLFYFSYLCIKFWDNFICFKNMLKNIVLLFVFV